MACLPLWLYSCSSLPAKLEVEALEAVDELQSPLPNELHWVRNSLEFRALVLQVLRLASQELQDIASEREPGTWAVVLDIDETVLSNAEFEKRQYQTGADFTVEAWHKWIMSRSATPIPGIHSFLSQTKELGGIIALVTNRSQPMCGDTEANLRLHDLPFDILLCREDANEKASRFDSIEEGTASADFPPLDIAMWVGDHTADFPGVDQEFRYSPEQDLSAFGRHFFILPNPLYGPWIANPKE